MKLKAGDITRKWAAECIDLFRDYLNDRFQLSLGSLTAAEAEKVLLQKGISEETAERTRLLMQHFENVIYTGSKEPPADAVDEILKEPGKVDILVNNAGIGIPAPPTPRWRPT